MFRLAAASIAVALTGLSIAALVLAQDRGPAPPEYKLPAEPAQMRVRKLPPVGASDPTAGVVRLDHSSQGAVSGARLIGSEVEPAAFPAANYPATETPLAPEHGYSNGDNRYANYTAEDTDSNANSAATLAVAESEEETETDGAVELAGNWPAVHKATGSTPETGRRTRTSENNYQSSNHSSSLQEKLNSLRASVFGESEEPSMHSRQAPNRPRQASPHRTQSAQQAQRNQTAQQSQRGQRKPNNGYTPPQVNVSQGTPTAPSEFAAAPQASALNSTAPEAPSVPRAKNPRQGQPTLADEEESSVVAQPKTRVATIPQSGSKKPAADPLNSSRRPRDLSALSELEPTAKPDDSTESASRGAASVASEPVEPAVPNLEDDVEAAPTELTAESSRTKPAATATTVQAEPTAEEPADNVLLSLQGPQLSAKAVGPRRIVVGKNAEFVVTVQNSGDVEANDVVVTLQLPVWAEVVSTEPSRGATQLPTAKTEAEPLLWRISRLEAGGQEDLKLNLIPRRSQPLDLAVRWTYAQTASNTLVEVQEPMLQMVISGPGEAVYGQTKLYNLTLSNPGTGDAENVMISLLPLEGKQEAAATTQLGTLKNGETKTIQVELSAGKAGMLLVKAKAVADGGLIAEAAKEVLVRRANLAVEVVAPEAEYAGNSAGYLVRVTNDGNATAEDVTVHAVLPEGAEYVESNGDGRYEAKQSRVKWDIGSLAAGQIREFTISARLNTPGANRLHAAIQDKSDLSAVADVQTAVVARADLKLLVTDPKGPVPVGDEAVYELRIRNRGTQAAEAIEAVIFFSEGIEPLRVEGADHEIGQGQVVFKTIPQINADGEIVLTVVARAERAGNHVFRAEVLCRSLGTKLAAEETTHFYGKELVAEAGSPAQRTAARPAVGTQRPATGSPLPAASIEK